MKATIVNTNDGAPQVCSVAHGCARLSSASCCNNRHSITCTRVPVLYCSFTSLSNEKQETTLRSGAQLCITTKSSNHFHALSVNFTQKNTLNSSLRITRANPERALALQFSISLSQPIKWETNKKRLSGLERGSELHTSPKSSNSLSLRNIPQIRP